MRTSFVGTWIACIAAAASAIPLPAQVQVVSGQIAVMGIGEANVVPDRATIYLGVQSRAPTAAVAGADNARRQRAILDTLRALGLSSDQLSTVNYSVTPETQFFPNGQTPPKILGYVVTNTIRADVRRIDDVGRVIDAALAKGANEMSGLQFFSSKSDSVRRVALAAAVAQARGDADALARAAGGSLGALIEMSTSEAPVRPMFQPAVRAMSPTADRTPVEPGQQTVTATVSARWAFVAGR